MTNRSHAVTSHFFAVTLKVKPCHTEALQNLENLLIEEYRRFTEVSFDDFGDMT
ncbi:hypothetical protein IQ268_03065 [Oculatella sp. LEGE 06141]|uniref:hypothetical protein n=1 Tax=Oculatella sp. LEGE 06141 TaxID=1828648 RepID=UPI001882A047|nr:hypothetical protein [Oculatella sp. LEGE 06141]MBE9177557.1 hypothetical protein [Oculatella sp. LEGE 06141]